MLKPAEIYQIKVTLRSSQPLIWRRIQVRSDATLAKLHRILQRVMGWEDAHLHQFVVQGQFYGIAHREEGLRKTKDEREYRLSDLVPGEGSKFTYDYDFGDNWEHVLTVEQTLPPDEGVRYPTCLEGARACPPEDVGGISGYKNFLDAVKNPDHPEHDEYLEWIGGEFNPEAFDVEVVNEQLRSLR
jgi:hypothetical protein